MELTNSKRLLHTATHVSAKLTDADREQLANHPTGAIAKLNLVAGLRLQASEIAALREKLSGAGQEVHAALDTVSRIVEADIRGSEAATAISRVSSDALSVVARHAGEIQPPDSALALLREMFDYQQSVSPVGWLYLERLENYPIGVERGEMVFTVPMAPREAVTISHKEWSMTSSEFQDIVNDYFESYSERGVAEKTDSTLSSENESRHSNSINFGASLSGGYGPVTLTTTLGLSSATEHHDALKKSLTTNREITEKASARSRKEHKVSVKLERKSEVTDSTFRTITNPSDDAIRLDFFRMMRKWRIDQYRYGLRMTYDCTIPTPGARLWARWREIAKLDRLINTGFAFMRPDGAAPLNSSDIQESGTSDLNWAKLADRYHAQVDAPPPPTRGILVNRVVTTGDMGREIFEFMAPPGYTLASGMQGRISYWGAPGTKPLLNISDPNWKSTVVDHPGSGPGDGWYELSVTTFGNNEARELTLLCAGDTALYASFEASAARTDAAFTDWQRRTWSALYAAALARHNDEVGKLQDERDKLWRDLASKDTLSLRRLEREELLRQVWLWLLHALTGYSNAPAWLEQTVDQILANEEQLAGGSPTPSVGAPMFAGLGEAERSEALAFGEFVKFLQEAIEWENLLYILYPYFWGSEQQGRDRLLFEHPDPEHQNFLRAGYARVVLTVRPGFEEDVTRLIETGSLVGPSTSPYMTIAEEIANRARTNYANIPPANPEHHARPLLYPQQRTTWDTMQRVITAITDYQSANGKYPAKLDDLPASARPFIDAWGNPLVYVVPGSGNDYDLFSYGADGKAGGEGVDADISAAAGASLVATWFDYTPTSGLDIEMNTKPANIA